MKILLVTHYYPAHRGGVELVAGELAKRLSEKDDIEIAWAASDVDPIPAGYSSKISYLPMRAANLTEEILGIPYPLWGLGSLNKLRKAVKKADLVHLHEYSYIGNMVVFLFASIYRKPILITQHIGHVPYQSAVLSAILSILNRIIGAYMMRYAGGVVFESRTIRKYFSDRVSFRREAHFIPNGVDRTLFFPVDAEGRARARSELGLPKDKRVLLFIGRFVEKKGLDVIRQLAVRHSDDLWVVVGWGSIRPEEWRLPNVRVLRDVRVAGLVPFYRAADLLVLPSKGEGIPLVVQEAMSCGTPVLTGPEVAEGCGAVGSCILSEGVTGADVVERWSRRISTFFADPGRIGELRVRVAQCAGEHWDWEKCTSLYYRVMSELVHR